jgi:hypothetical protein
MPNENSQLTRFMAAGLVLTLLCGIFQTLSAQTKDANEQSKAGNEAIKMTEMRGFYCNTKALNKTERERYKQLTGKLAAARVETKELPDGYAFRLQSKLITISEVAEWISWEHKCCPFFGFEIALERDNGPLWLKLRGADGVRVFIRAEFHVG